VLGRADLGRAPLRVPPRGALAPGDYPLRRDRLSGCFAVPSSQGCVYDDFDAILGAAHKLHQDGADLNLDSAGTRRAVCAYIGACAAADTYYAVIPRAKQW
jgi:hypothetical protein